MLNPTLPIMQLDNKTLIWSPKPRKWASLSNSMLPACNTVFLPNIWSWTTSLRQHQGYLSNFTKFLRHRRQYTTFSTGCVALIMTGKRTFMCKAAGVAHLEKDEWTATKKSTLEWNTQAGWWSCSTTGKLLPMRELREEYEDTRRILSMVSKERMYSSLSGLPRVLLALLLVLRLPGEKAAGPPEWRTTQIHTKALDSLCKKMMSIINVISVEAEEDTLILFRKYFSCC